MFTALFVCRNLAELNVDDPSFWFDDVLATRIGETALNCVMINLNSVMINPNFLLGWRMKQ